MAEIVGSVLYGLKNVAEGAVLLAKGIYDPTLPLKANLRPITSVNVPLAQHTVSVVKGRAYLFGGKTVGDSGEIELASSDVHVIILPSSGIEKADYQLIKATKEAPPRRYGHSAAVIDNSIYIFGGSDASGQPLNENGRVWVYNTTSNKWTHLDPPEDGARPDPRTSHSSIASEHPQPLPTQPSADILPQQPPDPELTIPSIPDPSTYGTLVIQGGTGQPGANETDTWTFDISTRTWAELPDLPGPSSPSPSLAFVGQRLYAFRAGLMSFLDLDPSCFNDFSGQGELGLAPLRPWQSLPPTSSAPDKAYPGERSGAVMVPVTTGQGRNYLLLVGGKAQTGEVLEDLWTLQLPPEGMSAASFKDAARMAIRKETKEAEWEEVRYYDAEDVMIQEGQDGRGIGLREGFAAAKATDVGAESVLLWGGIGADGKPRGDGLMVTIGI